MPARSRRFITACSWPPAAALRTSRIRFHLRAAQRDRVQEPGRDRHQFRECFRNGLGRHRRLSREQWRRDQYLDRPITGQQFGAFLEGGFATLANYGSISGVSNDGIVLGLGGMVTNASGASITGGTTGVYIKYRAAGTVTNSGRIAGTAHQGARVSTLPMAAVSSIRRVARSRAVPSVFFCRAPAPR